MAVATTKREQETVRIPRPNAGLSIRKKLGQMWFVVRESYAQPLTGEPRKPVHVAPGETAITFIGHSSFLLQTGGLGLLIDPVFARRLILLRRQRRPGVLMRDLPRIDAVLLTHAHMDHLNLPSLRGVVREMRRRGLPAPIAIVPRQVSDLIARVGFREIRECDWWQGTTIEIVRITATPAKHWGARMFSDTHRGFGGYTISAPEAPTIWHSGDTAYFGGFHEIGRRLQPDVALLPIGAYSPESYRNVHTSPEDALLAFIDSGAGLMVPMHFGTFKLSHEPMSEPPVRLMLAAEAAGLAAKIKVLDEGESLRLDSAVRTSSESNVEVQSAEVIAA